MKTNWKRFLKEFRKNTKFLIINRMYNYFTNNYKIGGLNYRQIEFALKYLWSEGHLGIFANNLITEEDIAKNKDNGIFDNNIFLTDYVPTTYDLYDAIASLRPIRNRANTIIPDKEMIVDKDIVIIYAQRNQKPVYNFADYWARRITDIEVLIKIQEIVHKSPFLIPISEDDKERIQEFVNELMEDNPTIFLGLTETNLIKAFISGAPYIMDKLYEMKQQYWNEFFTFIGMKNLGITEKKEHLIGAEVEANDYIIKDSADVFIDTMKEGFERFNKLFGKNLTIECKSETYLQFEKDEKDKDTDEGEETNETDENN